MQRLGQSKIEEAPVNKVNINSRLEGRRASVFVRNLNPMKTFALLFLLPLAIAVSAPPSFAQSCTSATCTAASPSESDFLAALPSSSNKNATVVVNIPTGTSSWTTQLSYTVPAGVTNLTIQGATTVNCTGSAGTSSFTCTA